MNDISCDKVRDTELLSDDDGVRVRLFEDDTVRCDVRLNDSDALLDRELVRETDMLVVFVSEGVVDCVPPSVDPNAIRHHRMTIPKGFITLFGTTHFLLTCECNFCTGVINRCWPVFVATSATKGHEFT